MEFELTRSRRRTIQLQIERDGSVVVRAPLGMPLFIIKQFVAHKHDWVQKHVGRVSETSERRFEFTNGSELPFRGQNYPIRMTASPRLEVRFEQAFLIPKLSERQAKILIIGWYKEQALRCLNIRLDHFATLMHVSYSQFLLSNAGTRWGSCTRDDNIRLNWRLMCTPPHIIDYVVVHELSHLHHLNHSKTFWGTVESVLPKYREAKQWCKDNGHILYF